MELTPKQENFATFYIETGNASKAYRKAYNAEEMKPETIHRKANELMANGKIRARIEALQAEHKERHKLTVDDLLAELEEARIMAIEKGNPNAMTQATMGKAKLLGLDKQMVEVKTEDHSSFTEWLAEIEEMDKRGERTTLLTPRC